MPLTVASFGSTYDSILVNNQCVYEDQVIEPGNSESTLSGPSVDIGLSTLSPDSTLNCEVTEGQCPASGRIVKPDISTTK
jgi:hypothetical protein